MHNKYSQLHTGEGNVVNISGSWFSAAAAVAAACRFIRAFDFGVVPDVVDKIGWQSIQPNVADGCITGRERQRGGGKNPDRRGNKVLIAAHMNR